MWRDDKLNPTDRPHAVSWVRIAAEDPIKQDDDYALIICHVVAFGGTRAFMPAVRMFDRAGKQVTCQTGEPHRGEGAEAYNAALAEGEVFFDERQARMRKFLSQFDQPIG